MRHPVFNTGSSIQTWIPAYARLAEAFGEAQAGMTQTMEQDIQQKLEEQDKKLDAIYKSVEKTRKYFLWVLIISLAVIILPLIGMAFIIPKIINLYTGALGI